MQMFCFEMSHSDVSSDPDCDINSVRWRPAPELPTGLCRMATASDHCVSLLLPGGSLLPVHL